MDNFKTANDRDLSAVKKAMDSWWTESMENHEERIRWWRESRFGMFVHWGVSSALGGVWRGKKIPGYSEHIMRAAEIPKETYINEAVISFSPDKFCAEDIIGAAAEAGMKYFIITAKHHDGFAMYPSDAYPYDIRMTQCSFDPMAELKAACLRHGIKFGFYYSHAWDWEHPKAPGNDWDYNNPAGNKNLYAQPGKLWHSVHPEMVKRSAL